MPLGTIDEVDENPFASQLISTRLHLPRISPSGIKAPLPRDSQSPNWFRASHKNRTAHPKMASTVPRPGPARLTPGAGLDEWLEEAKQCHYLPEYAMKQLCEYVKECLMEGQFHVHRI